MSLSICGSTPNLRKALDDNQLVIYYQPKVTWRGEIRSLEALVRWQSPERGLLAPTELSPMPRSLA
ncbi:RNase II stability modulator [Pseudescherichia vulneris]|nr:RNase II stability modulator [Pseudescherichia vulneris]